MLLQGLPMIKILNLNIRSWACTDRIMTTRLMVQLAVLNTVKLKNQGDSILDIPMIRTEGLKPLEIGSNIIPARIYYGWEQVTMAGTGTGSGSIPPQPRMEILLACSTSPRPAFMA